MIQIPLLFKRIFFSLGPPYDSSSAREFIMEMFLELAEPDTEIYPHYMCALDNDSVRWRFAGAKDQILEINVASYGCQ